MTRNKTYGSWSIIVVYIFFAIIGVSVLTTQIDPSVLAFYIVVSIITFTVYAIDKSAATKGTWRTSESTLHLLSLVGGWPGALVAQQKLRHKSKKQFFRFVYWITVALNCALLSWLLIPIGGSKLG
jgi:uncharacterized membrane protein YsdA (DUF1294 family)